ncbi:hypothetical protein Landi51_01598 [Colletotrichum acutatum]
MEQSSVSIHGWCLVWNLEARDGSHHEKTILTSIAGNLVTFNVQSAASDYDWADVGSKTSFEEAQVPVPPGVKSNPSPMVGDLSHPSRTAERAESTDAGLYLRQAHSDKGLSHDNTHGNRYLGTWLRSSSSTRLNAITNMSRPSTDQGHREAFGRSRAIAGSDAERSRPFRPAALLPYLTSGRFLRRAARPGYSVDWIIGRSAAGRRMPSTGRAGWVTPPRGDSGTPGAMRGYQILMLLSIGRNFRGGETVHDCVPGAMFP